MPIADAFPCTSHSVVADYFKLERKAHYIYVQMVQPLKIGAHAYPLMVWSHDNNFSSDDQEKRTNTIIDELKKRGVNVASICTDADAKCLSAQRKLMKLNKKSDFSLSSKYEHFFC